MPKSCIKTKISVFFLSLTLISTSSTAADSLKSTGLTLEWYQQALDLDVLKLEIPNLGLPDSALNSVRKQLKTTDTLKILNVRLDYQLHPYMNLFGGVGKVTDVARVDFSGLGNNLSDLVIDNRGYALSLGATFSRKYGPWRPTLHFVHSRLRHEGSQEDIIIDGLVPTLGLETRYGEFSTSLVYQAVEATFAGTVTAPIIGDVPVKVLAENKNELLFMAGWNKQIAKDTYLKASIGLNNNQQFQLQLNQRF